MQVSASDFIAIICALIGLIGAIGAYALHLHKELVSIKSHSDAIEKKFLAAQSENIILKKFQDDIAAANVGSVLPPIPYRSKERP